MPLILISYFILISLRKLRNGALELANGNWDVVIKPSGNDEVTDLTNTFNEMALSIKNYVNDIMELNKAYFRFVPEQFLLFLNKNSITEINLGDQTQEEMSIMFSDIRSFTEMSEKMTPKENFDFLNNYLGLVGPIVRDHKGFIDKYIGDAIMALFPQKKPRGGTSTMQVRIPALLFRQRGLSPGSVFFFSTLSAAEMTTCSQNQGDFRPDLWPRW